MLRTCLRQLALLALIGLAPAATAQTDARLVGTWEALRVVDADGEETANSGDSVRMTFTADGRLFIRFIDDSFGETETVEASYRVEASTLVFVNEEGEEQRVRYRFEGDELAMTPVDGPDETAYLRRVPDDGS